MCQWLLADRELRLNSQQHPIKCIPLHHLSFPAPPHAPPISSRPSHPHSQPSPKRSVSIVDMSNSAALPQNGSGHSHGLARMSYKQAMFLMVEKRVKESQLMQRKLYVSSQQQQQQQQQHWKMLSLEESAPAQHHAYTSSHMLQRHIRDNHTKTNQKPPPTKQHVLRMSFNGPTSSMLRTSPPPTTPYAPVRLPSSSSLMRAAPPHSMETLANQPTANAAHGHITRPRSSALADPLLNRFAVHI